MQEEQEKLKSPNEQCATKWSYLPCTMGKAQAIVSPFPRGELNDSLIVEDSPDATTDANGRVISTDGNEDVSPCQPEDQSVIILETSHCNDHVVGTDDVPDRSKTQDDSLLDKLESFQNYSLSQTFTLHQSFQAILSDIKHQEMLAECPEAPPVPTEHPQIFGQTTGHLESDSIKGDSTNQNSVHCITDNLKCGDRTDTVDVVKQTRLTNTYHEGNTNESVSYIHINTKTDARDTEMNNGAANADSYDKNIENKSESQNLDQNSHNEAATKQEQHPACVELRLTDFQPDSGHSVSQGYHKTNAHTEGVHSPSRGYYQTNAHTESAQSLAQGYYQASADTESVHSPSRGHHGTGMNPDRRHHPSHILPHNITRPASNPQTMHHRHFLASANIKSDTTEISLTHSSNGEQGLDTHKPFPPNVTIDPRYPHRPPMSSNPQRFVSQHFLQHKATSREHTATHTIETQNPLTNVTSESMKEHHQESSTEKGKVKVQETKKKKAKQKRQLHPPQSTDHPNPEQSCEHDPMQISKLSKHIQSNEQPVIRANDVSNNQSKTPPVFPSAIKNEPSQPSIPTPAGTRDHHNQVTSHMIPSAIKNEPPLSSIATSTGIRDPHNQMTVQVETNLGCLNLSKPRPSIKSDRHQELMVVSNQPRFAAPAYQALAKLSTLGEPVHHQPIANFSRHEVNSFVRTSNGGLNGHNPHLPTWISQTNPQHDASSVFSQQTRNANGIPIQTVTEEATIENVHVSVATTNAHGLQNREHIRDNKETRGNGGLSIPKIASEDTHLTQRSSDATDDHRGTASSIYTSAGNTVPSHGPRVSPKGHMAYADQYMKLGHLGLSPFTGGLAESTPKTQHHTKRPRLSPNNLLLIPDLTPDFEHTVKRSNFEVSPSSCSTGSGITTGSSPENQNQGKRFKLSPTNIPAMSGRLSPFNDPFFYPPPPTHQYHQLRQASPTGFNSIQGKPLSQTSPSGYLGLPGHHSPLGMEMFHASQNPYQPFYNPSSMYHQSPYAGAMQHQNMMFPPNPMYPQYPMPGGQPGLHGQQMPPPFSLPPVGLPFQAMNQQHQPINYQTNNGRTSPRVPFNQASGKVGLNLHTPQEATGHPECNVPEDEDNRLSKVPTFGHIGQVSQEEEKVKVEPPPVDVAVGNDTEKMKRKGRINYSSQQLKAMDRVFTEQPYPNTDIVERLALELNIPQAKIRVWFQNKRARARRKGSSKIPNVSTNDSEQPFNAMTSYRPLPPIGSTPNFPTSNNSSLYSNNHMNPNMIPYLPLSRP